MTDTVRRRRRKGWASLLFPVIAIAIAGLVIPPATGAEKSKAKAKAKAGLSATSAGTAAPGSPAGAPATGIAAAPGGTAETDPTTEFDRHYEEAQELYKAGNYRAALSAYEKAYALRPEAEPLFGVARCHHQLGRFEEASAHYERFLAAAPMHSGIPKARRYLVEVLGSIGAKSLGLASWEKARAAYARAVELHSIDDPATTDVTSGVLLAGLGEALAGLGSKDEALAVLGRALGAALGVELRARTEATVARLKGTRPGTGTSPIVWTAAGGGALLGVGTLVAVLLVVLLPRRVPTDTELGVFEVMLKERGP